MKVNIYYGGRGLIDDPTLFVLEKMEKVLWNDIICMKKKVILWFCQKH